MFFNKKKPEPVELEDEAEVVVEEKPQEEPKEERPERWKYKESDLVRDSGIPKEVFKAIRNGPKFPTSEVRTRKGATAEYTESGYYLILKLLGIRKDEFENQNERKWAILTRTRLINTYKVVGELADGEDTEIVITVGRSGNGNFRSGMIAPVRQDKDGRWMLDRKNPRALGLW